MRYTTNGRGSVVSHIAGSRNVLGLHAAHRLLGELTQAIRLAEAQLADDGDVEAVRMAQARMAEALS